MPQMQHFKNGRGPEDYRQGIGIEDGIVVVKKEAEWIKQNRIELTDNANGKVLARGFGTTKEDAQKMLTQDLKSQGWCEEDIRIFFDIAV